MTTATLSTPTHADRYGGGLVLAVVVHGAILGMLVWNVHFQSDDAPSVASAELWSATPQVAAPRAEQPPPAPAPPPTPIAKPQPPREDTAQLRRDADIAVAQQKAKEAERAEREQRLAEQRKAEAAARALAAERADQKARQRQAEEAERKRADAAARARQAADARQAQRADDAQERQRRENLARITGMAGATGDAGAAGTALRSAGFSASYAGRIAGRIKPNVVFPDALQGNPAVEVELRTSPDGHISTRRITKASGVAEWDQAVLRAIDRTEVLPADEQGRVPPVMTLIFRPKDLGA